MKKIGLVLLLALNMLYSPLFAAPVIESKKLAEQTLLSIGQAYEEKNFSKFITSVSEDFLYRGELEEFVRRDFRDYDGLRLNFFINRVLETKNGVDVNADWQIRFFTSSASRQIQLRGENLNFVFIRDGDTLKLKAMRGANPLFGARSPEIAASSGVSSAIVNLLQQIEDTGSRSSKQSALTLVAQNDGNSGSQNQSPVNVDIVSVEARYADGAMETASFFAISFTRPVYLIMKIRLLDNAARINLTDLPFEATDSVTGRVVRGQGNVYANQIATLVSSNTMTFNSSSQFGTFTFALDSQRRFNILNREDTTTTQDYACTV